MPPKPRPVVRDEVLNQRQLAARLDLDPRQIRNLHKEGLPKTYLHETGEERGYPWPACLHWYVQWKVEAETARFSSNGRLQAAQVREMEARAAKREHELEEARGRVLPVEWIAARERRLLEQMATEFRTFGQRVRADLVQLPDVVAVDTVLNRRIDEAIVSARTAMLGGADAELTLLQSDHDADDDGTE